MKTYESIGKEILSGNSYVFDKLDGNNVRAEWTPKKGFWKFGSRTQLIDESDERFGKSILLMKEKEEENSRILKDIYKNPQEATFFFEFHGPNSFAGVHLKDDPIKVTLIDVAIYKNGLVMPGDFIKYFVPKTDCAPLLYVGNVTQNVVESVRNRTLAGMTFEGVVCKQNRAKTHHPNRMFKIKSNDWIAKVKSLYTDEKILKELL